VETIAVGLAATGAVALVALTDGPGLVAAVAAMVAGLIYLTGRTWRVVKAIERIAEVVEDLHGIAMATGQLQHDVATLRERVAVLEATEPQPMGTTTTITRREAPQ
jgi:hypothetical protein